MIVQDSLIQQTKRHKRILFLEAETRPIQTRNKKLSMQLNLEVFPGSVCWPAPVHGDKKGDADPSGRLSKRYAMTQTEVVGLMQNPFGEILWSV